jgi:hypothetical protein
MLRTALFAMAICLVLLSATSTARAARVLPNRFAPLTPEEKRELDQRNHYSRLALGGFGLFVVLAAIGQLVFSIRNFQRADADEKKAWEEDPADNLAQALGIPLDETIEESAEEFVEPIAPPAPPTPRRAEPCGIIANHFDRLGS